MLVVPFLHWVYELYVVHSYISRGIAVCCVLIFGCHYNGTHRHVYLSVKFRAFPSLVYIRYATSYYLTKTVHIRHITGTSRIHICRVFLIAFQSISPSSIKRCHMQWKKCIIITQEAYQYKSCESNWKNENRWDKYIKIRGVKSCYLTEFYISTRTKSNNHKNSIERGREGLKRSIHPFHFAT